MLELWERLCALPHRGSTSAFERLAAKLLQEHLEAQGHKVQTQTFKAPKSYGPELIFAGSLLALGGWLSLWWISLVGVYAFWAHFSGWWTPWQQLFDRYSSQNLIAVSEREAGSGRREAEKVESRELRVKSENPAVSLHPPPSTLYPPSTGTRNPAPRTLLLMAHYDTAKTFFLYGPAFVRQFRLNFLFNAAFAAVLPFACFLRVVPQLIGAYFLLQVVLLIYRELTQPYVNGANDNATGVAVAVQLFQELSLEPQPNLRPMLALTGSEEVLTKGAEHLAKSGLVPPGALVLNIDNVGKGELFYATGEGMLVFHPYKGRLQELAKATPGAKPLEYRLAYFDTLPFAARGNPCLTLIRLEGGLPPNWHWPTDRPENVSWAAVEDTLAYARALVRQL